MDIQQIAKWLALLNACVFYLLIRRLLGGYIDPDQMPKHLFDLILMLGFAPIVGAWILIGWYKSIRNFPRIVIEPAFPKISWKAYIGIIAFLELILWLAS